jgi:hypothetical protein
MCDGFMRFARLSYGRRPSICRNTASHFQRYVNQLRKKPICAFQYAVNAEEIKIRSKGYEYQCVTVMMCITAGNH